MRMKKCKKCGRTFETENTDAYMCPDCSKEIKKDSVMREIICRSCGGSFLGGPRAWYCPSCRMERRKELDRNRGKTMRPLGSTDICVNCGKEYTVNSARQKYCPACADEAVKNTVRIHKRKYMNEHKDAVYEHKNKMRSNRNVCSICGRVYDADIPTVTCSPECARKLKKIWQDEADIRRGKRNLPAGVTYDSGLPKSGIVGVTYRRSNGKWQASYLGKYIGVYDTVPEAAEAIEKYKKSIYGGKE